MGKIQDIEKLFTYILDYSFLLPPLVILLSIKKTGLENIFIALFLYGVCFFFLNRYYDALAEKFGKYYYPIYTLLEYIVFTFIIWHNLSGKTIKKLIIVLSVFFVCFQTFYAVYFRFRTMDSIPTGIETILIFIYIFTYFYEQFKATQTQFLYETYFFWIAIGIMIYLGGSFFFYILANHMNRAQINQYWFLTFIIESLKNLLFAYSIYIYIIKAQKKSPSSLPNLDFD